MKDCKSLEGIKFANINHGGKEINNIGDYMQILAIDYLLKLMGISEDHIIRIPKNNLRDYDGEPVILPINFPFMDYVEFGGNNLFSENITPVFLGLTLLYNKLSDRQVHYLKRFQPIGCRDERTLHIMQKYEIEAYLNGCMTVTLPFQPVDRVKGSKVYFVDVPESLLDYVPKDIMNCVEFSSHILEGKQKDIKEYAHEIYDDYIKNAGLVVTSRLHCVCPCLAAGIPVILVMEECSYRFGWLESFLPIYIKSEFGSINWNVKPISIEREKKLMLYNAFYQINNIYDKRRSPRELSLFYQNRTRKDYAIDGFDSFIEQIEKSWTNNKNQTYIIWGITQLSLLVQDYIQVNFPGAKLVKVFDKYRSMKIWNVDSEKPTSKIDSPQVTIIVTAYAAQKEAVELFGNVDCNLILCY